RRQRIGCAPMSGVKMIAVAGEDSELRLDRWFKRRFPEISHGRLEKLLRTGQVRIDGRRARAADRVIAGQTIRVPPLGDAKVAPAVAPRPSAVPAREAEAIRAAILYRDAEII